MSVELIHGDCMAYMAGLPDKAFQLACVDPPYGIGAANMTLGSGNHVFKKAAWDSSPPSAEYFHEICRVSCELIVWGGNYFTQHLPPNNNWIVWDKLNPGLSFSEAELAWCSIKNNIRVFKKYSVDFDPGGKVHPTQKPIALYRWLLHHYAKPGWRILDTHLGSGSSAIAAHEMGYDFVGIEIDADYIAVARKRFDLMTRQIPLQFGGVE